MEELPNDVGGFAFEEEFLRMAHLDRKLVVANDNRPRSIAHFREVEWEVLIDRWSVSSYKGKHEGLLVLELPHEWSFAERGNNFGTLVDEKGRLRASYIYPTGVVDDGAIVFLENRYAIRSHYSDPSDRTLRIISSEKNGVVFREFGRIFAGDPAYTRRLEEYTAQAEAWMAKEYPEWKDPFAYWESP